MRASLASSSVLALAVFVGGCAGEGQTAGTDPASGPAEPPAGTVAAAAPHDRLGDRFTAPVVAATTLGATCRADAFCEDFESADPASHWSGEVVTSGGALAFMSPSASKGARSLRLAAAAGAQAFLRLDGGVALSSWSGAIGLSMRVDAPPAQRLAGPELVVGDASVILSYAHDMLVLEQRSAGQAVAAAVVGTPAFGAWQRVVIGVEVNESASAPYGRLEISVDGGDLQPMALMVPIYGATRELHAGVTSADVEPAAASIDDVMFFAK